jgi:hypothetical protein
MDLAAPPISKCVTRPLYRVRDDTFPMPSCSAPPELPWCHTPRWRQTSAMKIPEWKIILFRDATKALKDKAQ